MMRLGRASVIAVLFLVAWAATARAECARVLWMMRTSRNGLTTTTIADSFTSLEACKAARNAAPMQKLVDDAMRQRALLNPVCLPDTLDPREPKGK